MERYALGIRIACMVDMDRMLSGGNRHIATIARTANRSHCALAHTLHPSDGGMATRIGSSAWASTDAVCADVLLDLSYLHACLQGACMDTPPPQLHLEHRNTLSTKH